MVGWRFFGVGRVIIIGCIDVDIVVVRVLVGEMVWVVVVYNVEWVGDGGDVEFSIGRICIECFSLLVNIIRIILFCVYFSG